MHGCDRKKLFPAAFVRARTQGIGTAGTEKKKEGVRREFLKRERVLNRCPLKREGKKNKGRLR